jgi:hypothetical protein
LNYVTQICNNPNPLVFNFKPFFMSSNYLWKRTVSDDDLKLSTDFLTKSIHRVDDRRARHLVVWVRKSVNPASSLAFIQANIDCADFHPFANPWSGDEIKDIFTKTKCTKLLRLSTRSPGELTLSNTKGVGVSKRFNVTTEGIIFGNFKFKTTAELMSHMSKQECCFCLESITDGEATALKCGHIFHQVCLETNGAHSNKCPFCKRVASESFRMPKGETCMYTMLNFNDESYTY